MNIHSHASFLDELTKIAEAAPPSPAKPLPINVSVRGPSIPHPGGLKIAAVKDKTKAAFAVTEKGHEHDAEAYELLARQAAERAALQQRYEALAAVGAPPVTFGGALRFGLGSPASDEARSDMMARHYEYAAKKHREGENAYNPWGGLLTPSSHEKGGTPGLLSLIGKSVPKYSKKKEAASKLREVAKGVVSHGHSALKGVAGTVLGPFTDAAKSGWNRDSHGVAKALGGSMALGGFFDTGRAVGHHDKKKEASIASTIGKSLGEGSRLGKHLVDNSHAYDIGGLGILALPSAHNIAEQTKNKIQGKPVDKKELAHSGIELAGLGTLAAPGIAHLAGH